MGLAASQARLLTLTSRSIDLELQCLRYSAQEIRNTQKSCDLSEEHNEILDWLEQRSKTEGDELYTGNYVVDTYTTNGTGNTNSVNSANSGNTINLQGASFETLTNYGFALVPSSSSNSSSTQKQVTYPTADSMVYEGVTQGSGESVSKYNGAYNSFISKYGNDTFTIKNSNRQLAVDETPREYDRDPGFDRYYERRNRRFQEVEQIKMIDDEGFAEPTNNKGYTRAQWNAQLETYAASNGLNSKAFNVCVQKKGQMTQSDLDTALGKPSTGSKYYYYKDIDGNLSRNTWKTRPEAVTAAQSYLNTLPGYSANNNSNNSVNSDIIAEAQKDTAKLWQYIASGEIIVMKDGQAVNNYNVNEQDSDSYDIGSGSSSNQNYTSATWVKDKSKYEAAVKEEERRYDQEEKKLQLEDKKLQAKMTQTQTMMNAVKTEIESVKSFIQKNTEKSFTYGYDA